MATPRKRNKYQVVLVTVLNATAAGTLMSYEAKKHGSKAWIVAPLVSIGAHGFGAGMALRF